MCGTLFLSENLGNRAGKAQHTPTVNFSRCPCPGQFAAARRDEQARYRHGRSSRSFLQSSYDGVDRPAGLAGTRHVLVAPGERRLARRVARLRRSQRGPPPELRPRPLRRAGTPIRRAGRRGGDRGGRPRTRHPAARQRTARSWKGPQAVMGPAAALQRKCAPIPTDPSA